MKKVLCAVAAAAIAAPICSTQAATIYKQDGLTFKIKGDWQIQLRQDPGTDQDLDVEYDDLELKNSVEYDLGNDLTAFGELDFGFKNAADKSDDDEAPHLEEAYLGFAYKQASFLFGKTGSAGDEFGVAGAIETPVADDVFDKFGATSGDDLIKVEAEIAEMVTVIASYELNPESEGSHGNGEFFDIFVGVDVAGLSVGAAYQNYDAFEEDIEAEDSGDIDLYGISLAYNAKVVEIAADYSVNDADDSTIWNIYAGVPIQNVKLGAGYQMLNYDAEGEEDVGGWYANVTYKFSAQKNVSVFAEIAGTDEDDTDPGYLVGARIKF